MANAIIIPPIPFVSVAASSTAAGHEPTYVANDFAGVTWAMQPTAASGNVDLVADLGSDVVADSVMLFGVSGVSADMVLQIFAATPASPNFAELAYAAGDQPIPAGTAMPTPGLVTALVLSAQPVIARYWLIRIFYPAGGAAIAISRLVIGKRLQLERNFGFGATLGVRDLGTLDFSRRGVLQRARGRKLRTVGLTFFNIRKDEVEAQTRPLLERVGNTEMVAVVTDPAPHPDRQNRCYFGPLVGDLSHTWRKADLFEAKANVVSIF